VFNDINGIDNVDMDGIYGDFKLFSVDKNKKGTSDCSKKVDIEETSNSSLTSQEGSPSVLEESIDTEN